MEKMKTQKRFSVYLTDSAGIYFKVKQKESVKDLGIIMSDDCVFSQHIAKVITTATQISGWILRTFETRDSTTM